MGQDQGPPPPLLDGPVVSTAPSSPLPSAKLPSLAQELETWVQLAQPPAP